jgi:hypothetical protein
MERFADQVFTRKQLADYVGVSVATVDRGFGSCLQPFRIGGMVVFDRAQAERHFKSVLANRGECDGNCKSQVNAEPAVVGSRLRMVKSK